MDWIGFGTPWFSFPCEERLIGSRPSGVGAQMAAQSGQAAPTTPPEPGYGLRVERLDVRVFAAACVFVVITSAYYKLICLSKICSKI